jgi:hypothetical protein
LQRAIHQPNIISKCHNFNVSEEKANTMALKVKHVAGTKIVTDEYTL